MNLKLNGFTAKGVQQEWLAFMKRLENNRRCCLDFITGVSVENTPSIQFTGSGTPSDPLIATVIGLDSSGINPANPGSQIGLTANNGAAITYMRSDASPALNQSINPIWTGTHTFAANPTFKNTLPSLNFQNSSNVNLGFMHFGDGNPAIPSFISAITSSQLRLTVGTNINGTFTLGSNGQIGLGNPVNNGIAGQVLTSSGPSLPATWADNASTLPGNPSNLIGLTAINGSANTFMRSDATPALDQGIAPTWSVKHKWSITNNNPAISLLDSAYIEWRDISDNLIGTISTSKSIPYMTINNQSTGDFGIFSGTSFKFLVSTAGVVTVDNLSGTGNRMVIANPSGVLSTQAIPTIAPFASAVTLSNLALDSTPVSGKFEYDGLNLYFTANSARNVITSGAGIYTTDGALTSQRTITGGGFGVTWDTVGLFRITQGNSTVGATYDFNTGTDFLVFDAAHSANLVMQPATGLQFEYVDVPTNTPISQMSVDSKGIHFMNVQEFADNATAITGGLTVGYIYRTGDILKIVH